jgi:hypothetical protein
MENKTAFTRNWNGKLDCHVFTTLRLPSRKYKVGDVHEIWLNNKFHKFAKIKEISQLKITEIDEYIAGQDTGLSASKARELLQRMYANYTLDWNTQNLFYVLFETIN